MSRGGNDPAYAREKDIRRRQCAENPLDNTSDEVPKLQVEESTSFWAELRSPSTQRGFPSRKQTRGRSITRVQDEACSTHPRPCS